MRENRLLVLMSLLTILLGTIHQADDINRGMSPGGLMNLIALAVIVLWLYGTLVLPERRAGQVIILILSLLVCVIPVIHMRGIGVGFGTNRSGGLFFVWTILALGVTAPFCVVLSARLLLMKEVSETSADIVTR